MMHSKCETACFLTGMLKVLRISSGVLPAPPQSIPRYWPRTIRKRILVQKDSQERFGSPQCGPNSKMLYFDTCMAWCLHLEAGRLTLDHVCYREAAQIQQSLDVEVVGCLHAATMHFKGRTWCWSAAGTDTMPVCIDRVRGFPMSCGLQ